MNFKIFFFLIIIALTSNSHAQWWVDGGNAIWPHGNVSITKGELKVEKYHNLLNDLSTYWGDYPVTQNYFLASQRSWWGGLTVLNIKLNDTYEHLQTGSRMLAFDVKSIQASCDTLDDASGVTAEINIEFNSDSTSVWRASNPSIFGFASAIKYKGDGFPECTGNYPVQLYRAFVDEQNTTVVDTVPMGIMGYEFRMGSGNKLRYDKDVISFQSDLVSYSAATKLIGTVYHFKGIGDYPSYFGGAMIQKVYTYDVDNPPTRSDLDSFFGSPADVGAGFNVFIDDNAEGSNFYQVVCDGTRWWVFTASAAQ